VRVVLDTNVIIAAFAARGLCAEVFEVCLEGHTIILSNHILTEIKEKLGQKVHLPKKEIREIIAYLKAMAVIVEPSPLPSYICRDANDINIIGTAVSGGADLLVTGDNDLLVLKEFRGINIVSPRGFWERLSA